MARVGIDGNYLPQDGSDSLHDRPSQELAIDKNVPLSNILVQGAWQHPGGQLRFGGEEMFQGVSKRFMRGLCRTGDAFGYDGGNRIHQRVFILSGGFAGEINSDLLMTLRQKFF